MFNLAMATIHEGKSDIQNLPLTLKFRRFKFYCYPKSWNTAAFR